METVNENARHLRAFIERIERLEEEEQHHCRWPVSTYPETEVTMFCAERKGAIGSYCDAHQARSVNPLAPKKIDARPHW